MEILEEQACKCMCKQIVGVFEENCWKVGRIGAYSSDINGSGIFEEVCQVLQERVDQSEAKAEEVAELKEALTKETSLLEAVQQKHVVLKDHQTKLSVQLKKASYRRGITNTHDNNNDTYSDEIVETQRSGPRRDLSGMDGDKLLEFESAYSSICKRLKTLKSRYSWNQKVNSAENSENDGCQSRSHKTLSGVLTEAETDDPIEIPGDPKNLFGCNAEESTENHPMGPHESDAVNAHGRVGHIGGEPCEKGSSLRSSKSLRSPQAMEALRKQSQEWVCKQIVGAFEERYGNTGVIGTPSSAKSTSEIVMNLSQILQERVGQIEAKTKSVAASNEALCKEKNMVDALQQKRLVQQELLDQAFSTAENGIFMCSQCQYISEKIDEPQVPVKMDPRLTNCQFIVQEHIKTCSNVNNLQKERGSNTTSIEYLVDTENGKKDRLVMPLIEGTNNTRSKLCSINETRHMHHKNILNVTGAKLVDLTVSDTMKLGLESGTMTDLVSPLKRKWIDEECFKEGGPSKSPKQKSKMHCSTGSEECYSTMAFENSCTRLSHHDVVSNLVSDHGIVKEGEHSMAQVTPFRLVLEEESDDNLE